MERGCQTLPGMPAHDGAEELCGCRASSADRPPTVCSRRSQTTISTAQAATSKPAGATSQRGLGLPLMSLQLLPPAAQQKGP